jgi:arsenical pump membrane protein
MGAFLAAIAIFLSVLLLIIWQPYWGVGWLGLGGIFLTLALGIADLREIWQGGVMILPSLLSIVSLLLIARILEAAGFFRLLAPVIIFLGFGRGQWLFAFVMIASAMVSASLSNYGCVLFWTVAVVEALRQLRFRPQVTLAYVLGVGLMANGGSFLFPWSNPLNSLLINGLELSPWRYLLVMIPVQVVIVLLSLGVMGFYFNLCLPKTYRWRNRSVKVRDRVVCRWGFPILGILVLCFLFVRPPAVFVFLTALLTSAIAGRWYTLNSTPILPLGKIFKQLPWQFLLLSVSLYSLGITLGTTGLTYYLQQWLVTLSGWGMTLAVIGTGFTAALLSSFTNNAPTLVNYVIALQDGSNFSSRPITEAMIYANLIGCVLGAKLSPIGSLATLLWLDVVKRNVQHIYWQQYVRVYVALVLPVLFFSLLFLALWIPWLYP